MDRGGVDAVHAALDTFRTSLGHLIKLVEDAGLEALDDTEFVGFLQEFEKARNQLSLVDHQSVKDAQRRDLAGTLCHSGLTRLWAATLRISAAEAGRRVRAADALGARMSMTGEPMPPVRPHLAAAQRDGHISPEQIDIVQRALGRVDRVGFDPAEVDYGEQVLAEYAGQLGPKDLKRLTEQIVDRIDPDGTLPNDRLQAGRRFFTMHPTKDGGYAGEFRLTAAAGAKLHAVLGPLSKPRVNVTETAEGRRVEEPDPRTYGQRLHDAMEDVCDRLLRSDSLPDSGGTPATVIVTIDLQDLLDHTGYAVTSDGTLIRTDAALALVDEADVYWAVVDAEDVPLRLGRSKRIATPGLTAALMARDRGCSFPGCETPPEWCERHHIVPWVEGGSTDLDGMTLLCRYHHHHFLANGWECTINVDRLPEWRPPRHVDRERRPLVNQRIRAAIAAAAHRRP